MKLRAAMVSRIVVIGVLMFGLSACEALLATRNDERFPVPGRLVDVDGRNIQIDCRGEGSPTIVLEAGADFYGSLAWTPVQDRMAEISRVCSWSHAGFMWSDSRGETFQVDDVAEDLHAALAAASEKAPYVLVGHSRGALYNLIFMDLFPTEVAGFVFLDPSHPEQNARRIQEGIPAGEPSLAKEKLARALRWTGLLRVLRPCKIASLPVAVNDACNAWLAHSLDGYISETQLRPAVSARAAMVRNLGQKPVIVLTRQLAPEWLESDPAVIAQIERSEALWQQLHAEIASWSSRGQQRLVPDTNHQMLISHPAAIDAVDELVTVIRADN